MLDERKLKSQGEWKINNWDDIICENIENMSKKFNSDTIMACFIHMALPDVALIGCKTDSRC